MSHKFLLFNHSHTHLLSFLVRLSFALQTGKLSEQYYGFFAISIRTICITYYVIRSEY